MLRLPKSLCLHLRCRAINTNLPRHWITLLAQSLAHHGGAISAFIKEMGFIIVAIFDNVDIKSPAPSLYASFSYYT